MALAGLLCGCGESGTDQQPDNGNAGLETWDPVPIVGQWRLSLIERYASDGTLAERLYVDYDEQDIIFFNEAGFFRYFDCQPIENTMNPFMIRSCLPRPKKRMM